MGELSVSDNTFTLVVFGTVLGLVPMAMVLLRIKLLARKKISFLQQSPAMSSHCVWHQISMTNLTRQPTRTPCNPALPRLLSACVFHCRPPVST